MRTIRTILLSFLFVSPLVLKAQTNPKLEVANGHREDVHVGAASSDDRLLASSGWDGMVLWDVASGLALKTIKRGQRFEIPFSIPGSRNIGGIYDGTIRIYDGETLQERVVARISDYFIVKSIVTDPAGRYLYLSAVRYDAGRSAFIYKIDLQQNRTEILHEVKYSSFGITDNGTDGIEFANLTISPDGSKICAKLDVRLTAARKPENNYAVFNTQTFQKEKEWNAPDEMMGFVTNDLFWRIGKLPVPRPETINLDLLKYPSLQVSKTFPIVFSGFYIFHYVTNSVMLFDAPSKTFYLGSRKTLTSIDLNTMTAKNTIVDTSRAYLSSFISILLPSSKKMVLSGAQGALSVIDPLTKTKKPLGGSQPIRVTNLTTHPKRPVISMYGAFQDALQFIDLQNDAVKVYNHKLKATSPVAWSPDGRWGLFYNQQEGYVGMFDANNLAAPPRKLTVYGSISSKKEIKWSRDGRFFAAGPEGGIEIWDATTGKPIKVLPGNVGYGGGTLSFSNDGTKIVACTIRPPEGKTPGATGVQAERWIQCYRISDGSKLWEIRTPDGQLPGLAFTDNDRRIFGTDGSTLYSFDAATGAIQRTNKIERHGYYYGNFSPDSKSLFLPVDKAIGAIDVQTGTLSYTIPNSNNEETQYTAALAGGEFAVSFNTDNSLHIYDLKRKLDVGRLFTFYESPEHAVVSTQNYFEGSQQATAAMYFVKDSRILPLQSLFEKFYTPKLLQRLLTRTEPGPPVINVNNIKGAPTATISYTMGKRNLTVEDDAPAGNTVTQSNVTITVKATAPGDAVSEIRLYQNGKLIANNTRNLTVADDEGLDKRTYEVILQPGSNTFSAVSLNSQRTESMPAQLSLSYTQPKVSNNQANAVGPAKTSAVTTMHLVVIGINQYKNARYNLNYAVADAKGFQDKINGSCGTLLQQCKPYFISNAEATKDNIVKAMQKIAGEAAPQDMLVFYYAGHGVMNEAEQKEFFLVPHDVTQLYGNDAGLTAKGISSSELQKLSTTIKAQKQLFILDACQSAGALQQIAMRGAAEEKAIAQLARSTGTHWLTASGSNQFASEFDKLGHGAFTYVLINGLAGEAAVSGGAVTVNSLKAYIENKVPEITEKYKGSAQYPASYGFGQDFPIAIKK